MKSIAFIFAILSTISVCHADTGSVDEARDLWQTASKQQGSNSLDALLAEKHLNDAMLAAGIVASKVSYCVEAISVQSNIKTQSVARYKSGIGTINDSIAAMAELDRLKAFCK